MTPLDFQLRERIRRRVEQEFGEPDPVRGVLHSSGGTAPTPPPQPPSLAQRISEREPTLMQRGKVQATRALSAIPQPRAPVFGRLEPPPPEEAAPPMGELAARPDPVGMGQMAPPQRPPEAPTAPAHEPGRFLRPPEVDDPSEELARMIESTQPPEDMRAPAASTMVDPGARERLLEREEEEEYIRSLPMGEKLGHMAASPVVGLAELGAGPLEGSAVAAKIVMDQNLEGARNLANVLGAEIPQWVEQFGEKKAEEMATARMAEWIRETVQKTPGLSDDPVLQQHFLFGELPSAMGSFLGYGGQAIVMNAVAPGLGTGAALLSATGSGMGRGYSEAREAGVSEEDALMAGGLSAAGGAIQVMGPISMARRFRQIRGGQFPAHGPRGRLDRTTQAGVLGLGEEAGAEGGGQILFNAAAMTWDEDRGLFDDVARASVVGGVAGSLSGAGMAAVTPERRATTPAAPGPAEVAQARQELELVRRHLDEGVDLDGSPLTPEARDMMQSMVDVTEALLEQAEAPPLPEPGLDDPTPALDDSPEHVGLGLTFDPETGEVRPGLEPEAAAPEREAAPEPQESSLVDRIRRRVGDAIDPSRAEEGAELRRELEGAFRDPVTGLPNPTAWGRAVDRLDADPGTTLVGFDVTNFKAINDNLGWDRGNQRLREVSEVVREEAEARGVDSRDVFRVGGDEFAVAAPNPEVAQEIAAAVQERVPELQVGEFTSSVRTGVGATWDDVDAQMQAKKAEEVGPRARDTTGRQEAPAAPEAPVAPAAWIDQGDGFRTKVDRSGALGGAVLVANDSEYAGRTDLVVGRHGRMMKTPALTDPEAQAEIWKPSSDAVAEQVMDLLRQMPPPTGDTDTRFALEDQIQEIVTKDVPEASEAQPAAAPTQGLAEGDRLTVYQANGTPVEVTVEAVSETGTPLFRTMDGEEVAPGTLTVQDPTTQDFELELSGVEGVRVADLSDADLADILARVEEIVEAHRQAGQRTLGTLTLVRNLNALRLESRRRQPEAATAVQPDALPEPTTGIPETGVVPPRHEGPAMEELREESGPQRQPAPFEPGEPVVLREGIALDGSQDAYEFTQREREEVQRGPLSVEDADDGTGLITVRTAANAVYELPAAYFRRPGDPELEAAGQATLVDELLPEPVVEDAPGVRAPVPDDVGVETAQEEVAETDPATLESIAQDLFGLEWVEQIEETAPRSIHELLSQAINFAGREGETDLLTEAARHVEEQSGRLNESELADLRAALERAGEDVGVETEAAPEAPEAAPAEPAAPAAPETTRPQVTIFDGAEVSEVRTREQMDEWDQHHSMAFPYAVLDVPNTTGAMAFETRAGDVTVTVGPQAALTDEQIQSHVEGLGWDPTRTEVIRTTADPSEADQPAYNLTEAIAEAPEATLAERIAARSGREGETPAPDAAPTAEPAPTRESPAQTWGDLSREEQNRRQQIARRRGRRIRTDEPRVPMVDITEHFRPGRIVPAYDGRDQVVSFEELGEREFRVTVQEVDESGRPAPETTQRTHRTPPTREDIELARMYPENAQPRAAPAPEAAPDAGAPTPAPEATPEAPAEPQRRELTPEIRREAAEAANRREWTEDRARQAFENGFMAARMGMAREEVSEASMASWRAEAWYEGYDEAAGAVAETAEPSEITETTPEADLTDERTPDAVAEPVREGPRAEPEGRTAPAPEGAEAVGRPETVREDDAGERPGVSRPATGEPAPGDAAAAEQLPEGRRTPRPDREDGEGDRDVGDDPARGEPGHRDRASPATRGRNYRITESDRIGEGSQRQKAEANLEAIRLLKEIEAEQRPATDAEREVLVRYVGWGGIPQAVERWPKPEWRETNRELKDLLTAEEYGELQESIINAHYTSFEVVQGIYEAVQRLGFRGGRILEPSSGVGHFIGLQPGEIAGRSRWRAVEKDPVTGGIARLLYPEAAVQVSPFEDVHVPDGLFDAVLGNVPFAQYQPVDPYNTELTRKKLPLHDFFLAKSLLGTRPGGIVALITTKGTMDKSSTRGRKYLAQFGDLVGAIRLPHTAFKGNANTEVTTDILFFRRREKGESPGGESFQDLVNIGTEAEPIRVNEYFARNPDMMLGEMELISGRYGAQSEPALIPPEGQVLGEALTEAVSRLPEGVYEQKRPSTSKAGEAQETMQPVMAPPGTKEGNYVLREGKILVREHGKLVDAQIPKNSRTRVKQLVKLRDAVTELLGSQYKGEPDAKVQQNLKKTQNLYDAFVKKYGPINKKETTPTGRVKYPNLHNFDDIDLPRVAALENVDKNTGEITKATVLERPTIRRPDSPDRVETADQALLLSLNETGRVDIDRIAALSGVTPEQAIKDLGGAIYQDPRTEEWLERDQYLSGNVRAKLHDARAAAEVDPSYQRNVEALEAVKPEDKTPAQIKARPGAPWIPASEIEAFVAHILDLKPYARDNVDVIHVEGAGQWKIKAPTNIRQSTRSTATWGTNKANAIVLLEQALNMRHPKITKPPPNPEISKRRPIDPEATEAARQKQRELIEEFESWVWADPARAERLAERYNEMFNNYVKADPDGSHLTFPGMSAVIDGQPLELYPHQKDVVWRFLRDGNVGMFHAVGSGKTFSMILAAMEAKRLGLANKPMISVLKSTISQWQQAFIELYPGANILVTTEKDFSAKNRQKFLSRMAQNDWDAVIVTHEQAEKIPLSPEFQEEFIDKRVQKLRELKEAAEESGQGKYHIKQIIKAIKQLESRLKRLAARSKKDESISWEETGVDLLIVDEAHKFKNLDIMSSIQNLPLPRPSQRAFDLLMKTESLRRVNPTHHLILATGTPVANSFLESYVMQTYLQPDALEEAGVLNPDAWIGTFAQTYQRVEYTAAGRFKPKTRFKWQNVGDLSSMFANVADVKRNTDLPYLKLPEVQWESIEVEAPPVMDEIQAEIRSRLEKIKKDPVGSRPDNYLAVEGTGRKAAVDPRLVDRSYGKPERSKVTVAAEEVVETWREWSEHRGTQLIFLDQSTPKPGKWSLYQEMKDELVERGIPADQIAFIHDAKKDKDRLDLFNRVNNGEVRVLMGSREKMGIGVNVQERVVRVHDMDAPYRPDQFEQGHGRVIRQGNSLLKTDDNPDGPLEKVRITRYVTSPSYDAKTFGMLDRKQETIGTFLENTITSDVVDDVDQRALDYREQMGIASGDPRIAEKVKIDHEVETLGRAKRGHEQGVKEAKVLLTQFPQREDALRELGDDLERDIARRPDTSGKNFNMTVGNTNFSDREAAGRQVVRELEKAMGVLDKGDRETVELGSIGNFNIMAEVYDSHMSGQGASLNVQGTRGWSGPKYDFSQSSVSEVVSPQGVIQSLEAVLKGLDRRLEKANEKLETHLASRAPLEEAANKPFPHEARLNELLERQRTLANELSGLPDDDVGAEAAMDAAEDAGETVEDPWENVPQPKGGHDDLAGKFIWHVNSVESEQQLELLAERLDELEVEGTEELDHNEISAIRDRIESRAEELSEGDPQDDSGSPEGADPPPGAAEVGPRALGYDKILKNILSGYGDAQLRDLAKGIGVDSSGTREAVEGRILESRDQLPPLDELWDGSSDFHSGLPLSVLHKSTPVQAAKEVAVGLNDVAFIDLIDRLRKAAPDDARVQAAADAGRAAVNTAKEILGELAPSLRELLPKLGASPATARGRAVMRLQEVYWDDVGFWGTDKFRLAIENKLPEGETLTKPEQDIVDAVKEFVKETGAIAEQEGMKQFDHRTQQWRDFVVGDRDVAPRLSTLWYFDTLMRGDGARFDALVEAIVAVNEGIEAEEVRDVLRRQRAEILGLDITDRPARAARRAAARADEGGDPVEEAARAAYSTQAGASSTDQSAFRRINLEHTRVWPEFPSYIKDPQTGHLVELLETNPYRYVERLAELTSSRVGYVRHFGQETEPNDLINTLVEIVRDRKGGAEQILDMTRALNGLPVEQSFITQPGSSVSELATGLSYASYVLKSGALSLTFVPNAVEPMANIQALAGGPGIRDFWVGLWKLYGGRERRAATRVALEELGAIGLWVRNMSWNPQRPGESFSRIAAEAPVAVVRAFWRSQEKLATAVALAKVERMKAGEGTEGDIADARVMLGLNAQEAEAMAKGEGSDGQYLALVRRAGAFTTNSPMARGEISRLEHSRFFRAAFAFTRYAMMKVRWLGQYGPVVMEDVRALQEAASRRSRENTPETRREFQKAWRRSAASSGKVLRMLTGTTAAGVAQYFLMALVTGGRLGVEDAWEEFAEEPMRFLRDSFTYTMFAGPLGAILRTTQDQSRAWYESVVRVTWPGALAVEVTDFTRGAGRYSNRSLTEKLGRFAERFLPINRAVSQGMAALGYDKEARDMETAIRSYWRHMRRIDPPGRFEAARGSIVEDVEEAQKAHDEFRTHMRRAAETIRRGRDPSEHIRKALGVEGKDRGSVAQSIRARRLLSGPLDPESAQYQQSVREALEARVSDRTMELLQLHDQLLDHWSSAEVQPPMPSLPDEPDLPDLPGLPPIPDS